MLSVIFYIIRILIYFTLFIVLIPDFFFLLPKGGDKLVTSLVHGLLYSTGFIILYIIFSIKRIYACAKSEVGM
jgi:hypothetical protein